MIPRRWLSIREAAHYTGWSPRTLQRKVQERQIPHIRKGRTVRFDIRELDAWLLEDRIPTADEIVEGL